jgi:hypothetical protein
MLGRVGKFEQVGFIPERMNMTVSASWTLMETSTKRGGNKEADAYEIQVQAVGFKDVWTSRIALADRSIERNASRHYIGRVVATVLSWSGHQTLNDTQCGLKFFQNRNHVERVILQGFGTNWLFEMEILVTYEHVSGVLPNVSEVLHELQNEVTGEKMTVGGHLEVPLVWLTS